MANADLPRWRLDAAGIRTRWQRAPTSQNAALPAMQQEIGHAHTLQSIRAGIQGISFADAAQIDPHAGLLKPHRPSRASNSMR